MSRTVILEGPVIVDGKEIHYKKAERDIYGKCVNLYHEDGRLLETLIIKHHYFPLGDPIGMVKSVPITRPLINNNIGEKKWRQATEKDFGITTKIKKQKKY